MLLGSSTLPFQRLVGLGIGRPFLQTARAIAGRMAGMREIVPPGHGPDQRRPLRIGPLQPGLFVDQKTKEGISFHTLLMSVSQSDTQTRLRVFISQAANGAWPEYSKRQGILGKAARLRSQTDPLPYSGSHPESFENKASGILSSDALTREPFCRHRQADPCSPPSLSNIQILFSIICKRLAISIQFKPAAFFKINGISCSPSSNS